MVFLSSSPTVFGLPLLPNEKSAVGAVVGNIVLRKSCDMVSTFKTFLLIFGFSFQVPRYTFGFLFGGETRVCTPKAVGEGQRERRETGSQAGSALTASSLTRGSNL